jgi:hypothetical protein
MSRESAPLVFIKFPDTVADSYEATLHDFMGLIISAENEDTVLTTYSDAEIDWIKQGSPERYDRVREVAEFALSRGMRAPDPMSFEPLRQ